MTTNHPADPAEALRILTEFVATRPVRFTEDDSDGREIEWRNDYEERAMDMGPRYHYPEGA